MKKAGSSALPSFHLRPLSRALLLPIQPPSETDGPPQLGLGLIRPIIVYFTKYIPKWKQHLFLVCLALVSVVAGTEFETIAQIYITKSAIFPG